MSENVSLGGNIYIIPDVGESGWGQNLTNYFVAIPANVLQKAAGLFAIQATLDFGPNFGIISAIYTSRTASAAPFGNIRLAATDSITFGLNSYALTTDGSGNLTWRGSPISVGLTTGNLTDAGTDGITVTGGTGAVVGSGTSLSQHVADASHNGYLASGDWSTFNGKQSALSFSTGLNNSSGTITNTGVLSVVNSGGTARTGALTIAGTTNEVTITDSPAGTFTFSLPQAIASTSAPTFAGLTLTAALTLPGSGNTISGSGSSITLAAGSASAAAFASDSATLFGVLNIAGTTNQLVLASSSVHTTTLTAPVPAGNRTYTIPDAGAATANVVLDQGNYTIAGTWTFSTSGALIPSVAFTKTLGSLTAQWGTFYGLYAVLGGSSNPGSLIMYNTSGYTAELLTSPSVAGARVYTLPEAGANANVVLDQGNYTIAGTWTFSSALTTAPIAATGASTSAATIPFTGIGGSPAAPPTSGTTPSTGTVARLKGNSNAILEIGSNSTTYLWLQGTDATGYTAQYPIALNPNGGDVFSIALTSYGSSTTLGGWTSTTTKNIYYKKVGHTVTVYWLIVGTSNGASASFTLPYACNSSIGSYCTNLAADNGVYATYPGMATISAGGSSILMYKDQSLTNNWTASGTKVCGGTLIYEASA